MGVLKFGGVPQFRCGAPLRDEVGGTQVTSAAASDDRRMETSLGSKRRLDEPAGLAAF